MNSTLEGDFLCSLFFPDFVESSYRLERLNVSHNMLTEFNGDILSNCKQLLALDVSHNQIATLKLNEVKADNRLFIYSLASAAACNSIEPPLHFHFHR